MDLGILLDNRCSVTTTGCDEDFCGQLAYGHFGIINMADGMAEIKGFGMELWDAMDANGEMALIRVPTHCVPTVEMQLLSPQDHTKHNEIKTEHAHSGNANFMKLQIATPEHLPGKRTSTVISSHQCLSFLLCPMIILSPASHQQDLNML